MRCWMLVPGCMLVAGCELLFPLTADPSADAPIAIDGLACVPATATVISRERISISADPTFIAADTFARIDERPTRALWKFSVPGEVINRSIVGMRLTLPFLATHPSCGDELPCGASCAPLERDGAIEVFSVVVDWGATSSWTCQQEIGPCFPWGEEGAGGASRGPKLGAANHVTGMDTTVAFDDINGAFTMAVDGELAVLVKAVDETSAGAAATIPGTSLGGTCTAGLVELDFDYCP